MTILGSSDRTKEGGSLLGRTQRRRAVLLGDLEALRHDLNRYVRALGGDWNAIDLPVPEDRGIAAWLIDYVKCRIEWSRHTIRETEAELKNLEMTFAVAQ